MFEETLEERPITTSVASPGEPVVKAFEIVDRVKRGSDSHIERWKCYDGWSPVRIDNSEIEPNRAGSIPVKKRSAPVKNGSVDRSGRVLNISVTHALHANLCTSGRSQF